MCVQTHASPKSVTPAQATDHKMAKGGHNGHKGGGYISHPQAHDNVIHYITNDDIMHNLK